MSLSEKARQSAKRVFAARGDLLPNERLLVVETDEFVASALLRKVDTLWYCMQAAPTLQWMMGKDPETFKETLLKMRARWEFVSSVDSVSDCKSSSQQSESPPDGIAPFAPSGDISKRDTLKTSCSADATSVI